MTATKTIAAIASPHGAGGIAVIRVSGADAIGIAARVFRGRGSRKLDGLRGYSGMLGDVIDGSGNILDEAIAYVYRAPKSYTGEDVVEISCHGGVWLSARVLRLLCENGAEPASPGEFTKRAFLNGKLDLSQAEAVMDLIGAQGDAALKAAANAHRGAVAEAVRGIAGALAGQSAHLAAWSDFPEEGLEEVDNDELAAALNGISCKLDRLIISYDGGRILREGVVTAIAGKPNAGKSTLMNMLAGYERSIVTDIPGTTRDTVSEGVRVGGLALHLNDTAGLRNSDDPVESIGIRLAKDQLANADLTPAVFDSACALDENDYELIDLIKNSGGRAIAVINKTDLEPAIDITPVKIAFDRVVMISAKNREGADELERAILKAVGASAIDTSAPVVASERQRACLMAAKGSISEALDALASGMTLDAVNTCLDEALDSLLSLTGEKASDRVIDEVFLRFCVGK